MSRSLATDGSGAPSEERRCWRNVNPYRDPLPMYLWSVTIEVPVPAPDFRMGCTTLVRARDREHAIEQGTEGYEPGEYELTDVHQTRGG